MTKTGTSSEAAKSKTASERVDMGVRTSGRRRTVTQAKVDADEAALDEKTSEDAAPAPAPKRQKTAKGVQKTGSKLQSPAWNTSSYRGVTRHRRSGRWEAHIWIGKGVNKQIYLGGYEKEEHAAEAYDMAALKTKGFDTPTNFSKDRYRELESCLENATLEEVVTAVRRQSQGFSRGTSTYRGVSPHPSGRFEARIGIAGNKHVYLGLFHKEADAARAYDQAVVRIKGTQASTNFTLSDYGREMAEHSLKHIELEFPDTFAMMRDGPASVKGRHVPTPTQMLRCGDGKPLTSCTDQHFQKWVRVGYPPQDFARATEAYTLMTGSHPANSLTNPPLPPRAQPRPITSITSLTTTPPLDGAANDPGIFLHPGVLGNFSGFGGMGAAMGLGGALDGFGFPGVSAQAGSSMQHAGQQPPALTSMSLPFSLSNMTTLLQGHGHHVSSGPRDDDALLDS